MDGNNQQNTNANNSPKKQYRKKNSFNKNGNTPNFYGRAASKAQQTQIAQKMKQVREKREKKKIKDAISTAAGTAGGPAAKLAAKALLNTSNGDKYVEAYKQGSTPTEKINNVKRVLKMDIKKIKIIGVVLFCFVSMLFFLIFLSFFFKTVDSQTYSNENGGTYKSENYIGDDKVVNIFANYPNLYEKIVETANKVSDQYKVEVDKYLIIATLVEPIANELIVPVNDNSCGEENCYYFKGESKTWSEFLVSWSDQTELLAKMQMLTYINNEGDIKVNCGAEKTMEQYAQNDLETNTFPWYGWLNPVNWFRGFRDSAAAEVNAKCVDAKNGSSVVPTVRVISIDQGTYYSTNNANRELVYEKDPNSGGVYFWNLINKNGFIHEYLKDYLSSTDSDDPDKNYEINKKVIVDTVNDIYSYYETIRKDCNGHQVMKGQLDKIKFREDFGAQIYTLDFEEVFVGGNLLATFPGAKGEVAKAQAIATRSEAYYNIVEEGAEMITGTQIMGCWWWKYNPTYDPSYENQADNPNYDPDYPKEHFPEIYKAVTETKGIVVTSYDGTHVLNSQFDSFCPVTRDPQGGFYYLPDGQRNLPIDVSRFSISKKRTECPCFQNKSSRPSTEFSDTFENLLNRYVGTPAQTTTEACWEATGQTKRDELGNVLYGYKYSTSGGHGQGISQHGMAYFAQFGYDHEALIKLFMERNNYGVSFKRYDGSIEDGECVNHGYYNRGDQGGSGSSGSDSYNSDSNYDVLIGGNPLTKSLVEALQANGHTIDELNQCIKNRVEKAGPGTREGVVEAGMGLLECTMSLTGGYTYPYDHTGGKVGSYNPDITGKLGVNSKWGFPGGVGCKAGTQCRYGLNCATFVRWSMCNGGMDLCTRGSAFAHEMYDTTYFPEATKVRLSPGFQVLKGNISVSSALEAYDKIKPGDMLYSDRLSGGANHVMLIVGKHGDVLTIAENGRQTRNISKNQLFGSRDYTYGVLLLDDYYANSANRNSLY